MLNMLKEDIERESRMDFINEATVDGVDTDIRDAILDEMGEDEEYIEADTELAKIVNKIPEYDEEKEMNKKIKRLTESYIPEYDL
ncbi:hypothetical protein [Romboutsia ilealis]|uniref:hypothetical protein n=1 Tax=Romboutsia ilealis TaxID=1115758 RepID=UPI00272AC4A1|nr:hypothetical protein [Romboutsia ilealis]